MLTMRVFHTAPIRLPQLVHKRLDACGADPSRASANMRRVTLHATLDRTASHESRMK